VLHRPIETALFIGNWPAHWGSLGQPYETDIDSMRSGMLSSRSQFGWRAVCLLLKESRLPPNCAGLSLTGRERQV